MGFSIYVQKVLKTIINKESREMQRKVKVSLPELVK